MGRKHNTTQLVCWKGKNGRRSNGKFLSITGKENENDGKYQDLAAKFLNFIEILVKYSDKTLNYNLGKKVKSY